MTTGTQRVRTIFDSFQPRRLPPPLLEEWTWQLEGSCRGLPSETFFPEALRGKHLRAREAAAKSICQACPVLTNCRDHALRAPEMHGIWGATTPLERAQTLFPERYQSADAR